MKSESGRNTMQGTTITQGKAHKGSWLPNRIPYKYLRTKINKKSQAGCLPQVWGEGIGGCKGASPADSCNLRDVKTNGRPDAAY